MPKERRKKPRNVKAAVEKSMAETHDALRSGNGGLSRAQWVAFNYGKPDLDREPPPSNVKAAHPLSTDAEAKIKGDPLLQANKTQAEMLTMMKALGGEAKVRATVKDPTPMDRADEVRLTFFRELVKDLDQARADEKRLRGKK
jgi:hypothetical protein